MRGFAGMVLVFAIFLGGCGDDGTSSNVPDEGYETMSRQAVAILLAVLLVAACARVKQGRAGRKEMHMKTVHDFVVRDIDGNRVDLADFRGKVLLLVNVASQCGFTSQYEGLQGLYARYADRGFAVLAFPANDFGAQEPGTDEEIKAFASSTYGVTFPMFSKISVKGEDKTPIYGFLTQQETNPGFSGDISWNFNKFLVDPTGKVIARFESADEPESPKVIEAIEKALR